MNKKFRLISSLLSFVLILNIFSTVAFAEIGSDLVFSLDLSGYSASSTAAAKGITDASGANSVDAMALTANGVTIDSFENMAGQQTKYMTFTNPNQGALYINFNDFIGEDANDDHSALTFEFWAQLPDLTQGLSGDYGYASVFHGRNDAHTSAGNQAFKFGIENRSSSRYSMQYSNSTNIFPVRDGYASKWTHFVATFEYKNGTYSTTIYVNGVSKSTGSSTRANFGAIDTLVLGTDASWCNFNQKIASFNIYESTLAAADALSLYNASKNAYTPNPFTVSSHTGNGEQVAYPLNLAGTAILSGTEVLKVKVGDANWTNVTVSNGNWTHNVSDGALGDTTVTFGIFANASATTPTFTKALTFEMTREILLENAAAAITSGSPVSGTVDVTNVAEISTYSVLAVLYDDGKMLGYDEVEAGAFSITENAGDNSYVKVFAVDTLDNAKLLSNIAVIGGSDPSSNALAVTAPTNGVNFETSQNGAGFDISLGASKTNKDGVVVIKTGNGTIDYINTVTTNAVGKADFKYVLNNEDLNYTIKANIGGVTGNGSFKYYNETYINGLLQAIKNATAETIYADVLTETTNGYGEALALDLLDYDDLHSDRKLIVNGAVAGKEYSLIGDFKNDFAEALEEQYFLNTMQNTSAAASDVEISGFTGTSGIVGDDLDGLYSFLTADEKTEVFTAQKLTPFYSSYADYIAALDENVAVKIVNAKTADEFVDDELVEDYATDLGIANSDKAAYTAMVNKDKKRVIAYLQDATKEPAAIESYEDINTKFAAAVVYVSDPANTTYNPIMKLDFSNASMDNGTASKGIVETVANMTVTVGALKNISTYKNKSGGTVKYAEFNGDSHKITVNMGTPEYQEATVAFWANLDTSGLTYVQGTSNSDIRSVFELSTGSHKHMWGDFFLHRISGGSSLQGHVTTNAGTKETYAQNASYLNDWKHYVFTYKWNDEGTSVTYEAYVNGIAAYVKTEEVNRKTPSTYDKLDLVFGGQKSKFKLSDVAYYTDALDADTISEIYNDESASHAPAAYNILNYTEGQKVTYPFTLEGTASVAAGGKFEISLDGETYEEITVAAGDWTYTFDEGEYGVQNVAFKLTDASQNVVDSFVLPITFAYPLTLHTPASTGVSVQKVYSDDASEALTADIVAVVYNPTTKTVEAVKADETLSNLDSVDVLFANSTYTDGSYIKYMAVDDISTMNLLAEPVLYPQTAVEATATAQYVIADNEEINADVTTLQTASDATTYNTTISLAAITESDKAIISVQKGGTLCYFGVVNVNADGTAAVSYIQDTPAIGSDYTMNAKIGDKTVTKTFKYTQLSVAADTLTAIAGTNVDNFEATILDNATHMNVLQVDTAAFDELDGTVYETNVLNAVAGKTFETVKAFKDTFIGAVEDQSILKALNESNWDIDAANDDVDADALLRLYATKLGIDLSKAYDKLDNLYKEELLKDVVSGKDYSTIADFTTAFNNASMVELFDYLTDTYIVDNNIMSNYQADFNLNSDDLTKYNGYSRTNKIAVIDAMKLAGVDTYSDLRTEFNTAVNGIVVDDGGDDDDDDDGDDSGFSSNPGFIPTPNEKPPVVDQTEAEAVSNSIFKDMRTDHWAYPSVEKLVNLGVLNGIGDGKFNPEGNVTREQYCKMLLEALDIEVVTDATSSFADVNADAWYYGYVATAQKLGIINGISDSQFGVGKSITRAEMCAMVSRAVEYSFKVLTPNGKEINFTDAHSIPKYAVEYVKELTKAGIINGFEDSTFRANATATRAMAAKVIDNLIGNIK